MIIMLQTSAILSGIDIVGSRPVKLENGAWVVVTEEWKVHYSA